MKSKILATSADGSVRFASVIDGEIIRRAALVALLIGSVLTLVNQSAAIFGSGTFEYLQLALVFMTPFAVVAISQALGIRQAMMDARRDGGQRLSGEPVWAIAIAHGIPLRTLFVGILAGSTNVSIVIAVALSEGAGLNSLPVAVLAQGYVLPILFGLLSQSIAYRRAIQSISIRRVAADASPDQATRSHGFQV